MTGQALKSDFLRRLTNALERTSMPSLNRYLSNTLRQAARGVKFINRFLQLPKKSVKDTIAFYYIWKKHGSCAKNRDDGNLSDDFLPEPEPDVSSETLKLMDRLRIFEVAIECYGKDFPRIAEVVSRLIDVRNCVADGFAVAADQQQVLWRRHRILLHLEKRFALPSREEPMGTEKRAAIYQEGINRYKSQMRVSSVCLGAVNARCISIKRLDFE
ncbi:unnamed protein product [Phytophthora lilii]|uniref:Unnamed protein product n=1 Tax=Phytophthora lilii TaxID=2077276 RepID=A0A9W6T8H1_9STRA|nr:unnamed protein product [Phytophthora lilii]